MEWMLMPYKRYFDFEGRSRRMEYWMFTLFTVIVAVVLVVLMLAGVPWGEMETNPNAEPGALFWVGAALLGIFWLATFIPSIAVHVRRFHDQDKSGWMYLLAFVPYIGGLVVLIFMFFEGTRGENRFGPDPKDPGNVDVFR